MTYIYPNNEFQKIWGSNPLIIMDTNVILELYRYSPDTTEHILNVLNSLPKHQLWIPAQVIEEYTQNRESVINEARNKYKEVTKMINQIISNAEQNFFKQFTRFNKLSFPKVNELNKVTNEAIKSMKIASQKYADEINHEVEKNKLMLKEDKVKTFVDGLISNGCIGTPFGISKLLNVLTEGEQRYKYKIPPGYMDDHKDIQRKFGDLILWKQTLEQAKLFQQPTIFITLDTKEDWWVLDEKRNPLRPRDELLMEFKEYSKKPLAIMQFNDFIEKASKIIDMVDYKTNLEMNATEYGMKFIDHVDWERILDNDELLEYLIQNDILLESFNKVPFYIEFYEIVEPDLKVNSVDIQQNAVVMEGSFESQVSISITEEFSKNYSCESYADITFSGSITFEFEANSKEDEDILVWDTLTIEVGGFEILDCAFSFNEERDVPEEERCRDCGNPNASYHTKMYNEPVCERCSGNYDVCPNCGFLLEHGTLSGSYCNSCEMNYSRYN
ncbi:PIN domain-containing protein [Bacillus thuringiensis]|nr:PIN domain-containing protein [Bacillus thuringiensis]